MSFYGYATKAGVSRDIRLNRVSIEIIRKRQFLRKGSPYLFPSKNPKSESGHKEWM